MKSVFTALLTITFVASAFAAKATVITLDTKASAVKWVGKKVTGQHNGKVSLKDGTANYEGNKLTGGQFNIDMTTIVCEDLTDAGYNKKLVDHLKSEDFFSVEKNPTAVFKISKVEAAKNGENKITGELTIKGITKPVVFNAKVSETKGTYSASGKFKINRTDWDIKYNSGKFFDPKALGDKLINDEIEIELDLKGTKSI